MHDTHNFDVNLDRHIKTFAKNFAPLVQKCVGFQIKYIKCVLCNSSVENCYFNKGAKKQRLYFRNIIEVLRGPQIKLIHDISN